ncbi:MAG: CpXC domain-containing protein [Anaerolineae bacterium]|nr:CpXC domain-containing protein [Anaerolineae bacterium]
MPPKVMQTTIQCSQCRQPVRATVQSLVDAAQDPQAKVTLLAGRLNMTQCPNCGTPNSILTPLLYHDGGKELLISYVPMELGLSKDAQEKAIGDLMRELTSNLPQGTFKAYMLQPRQALTMQGLVEQVLQSDGVTPEMLEAQRARVRLVEMMINASPETLPELVKQHDAEIDSSFLNTMTMIIQQFAGEGRVQVAERVAEIQNRVVELSTFGKELLEQSRMQETVVAEVAEAINALGHGANRTDFRNLAIKFASDDQRLQALVGLVRPAFDYTFFQEFTTFIAQSPAAERDALTALREKLTQLTAMVDQQAQMELQEAVSLLRELMSSPNPDEFIQENLPLFDTTFMQVLSLNVQEAQKRGDLAASARLKEIYNRVISALQTNMPPELRFINDLLGAPSDAEANALLDQHAQTFGPSLLAAFDAVEGQLAGQASPALIERFDMVRQRAAQLISN